MKRPVTLLELLRRSVVSRPTVRTLLVTGTLIPMVSGSQTVIAGDILRGGSVAATSGPANRGASADSSQNIPGTLSTRDSLARTAQALQAVQAMQTAARNAAKSGPNNLGNNPNHPGTQLPAVPDGLARGGLRVAPGVPVDLGHPGPSEDPALWRGAELPTQQVAANGETDVTVTQTAQQALLTWETFNIGKNTTLTFDQNAGEFLHSAQNVIRPLQRKLFPQGRRAIDDGVVNGKRSDER